MKNANVIITGIIGSGKTSLAKRLLAQTPRAITFDPVADYDESYGFISEDFNEAVDVYMESRHVPFSLIFRPTGAPEAQQLQVGGLLRLVLAAQEHERSGPIALFFEESTTYSTLHEAMPEILKVFQMGRRWRINSVSIVQRDTTISPTIRACTQLWVTTKQMKLSGDYKSLFDQDKVRALQDYNPTIKPVLGVHYLTAPEGVDLFSQWTAMNRQVYSA